MLYGDDEDTRSFKDKGKVPGIWNQVQHVPTSTSRTHLEFALLSMLTMLHNVDKAFSRRCFLKLQWVSKQIAPVGEKILINTFHWKKNHHAEKSEYRNSFFTEILPRKCFHLTMALIAFIDQTKEQNKLNSSWDQFPISSKVFDWRKNKFGTKIYSEEKYIGHKNIKIIYIERANVFIFFSGDDTFVCLFHP